ncbi:hypothetical protein YTPLAS72_05760 [Nitrospira sp.]|nr:hypothetical protein YTPLAS72_05760 [Nitrospira sp.]
MEVDSGGGMFAVDLSAERIAIEHYREKTVSLDAKNLANQQVLEMVLALEGAQAESLVSCVRDCTSEREIEVTALPSASCAQH